MTEHLAFFGDNERRFKLTPALILELEKKTNAGIGSITSRLIARQFHHGDVLEVIRLALVGGGEQPQRAAELVATYAAGRPLAESYLLAVDIVDALWNGNDESRLEQSND